LRRLVKRRSSRPGGRCAALAFSLWQFNCAGDASKEIIPHAHWTFRQRRDGGSGFGETASISSGMEAPRRRRNSGMSISYWKKYYDLWRQQKILFTEWNRKMMMKNALSVLILLAIVFGASQANAGEQLARSETPLRYALLGSPADTVTPLSTGIDFSSFRYRKAVIMSILIPGAGQTYFGQTTKGAAFSVVTIGSLGSGICLLQ